MTVPAPPPPGPPDPDDAHALTRRERALLDGIEADLAEADPALARELATRGPPVFGARLPISVRQFLVLIGIMVVLSGATLLPQSVWWPVLPLLTLLLVLPWAVYCARHPANS